MKSHGLDAAEADEQAGQQRDDMRRIVARMHLREDLRQQAVAAHHEEDAGLAEHHHQDDRRQREARGEAEQVADLRPADFA